ncbi:MAG TPA: beta-propeller fold lactonase family protein, partial [Nevskia sp.]|nr:beta-propeller fold lactonase family protein [Nevskia sp.]
VVNDTISPTGFGPTNIAVDPDPYEAVTGYAGNNITILQGGSFVNQFALDPSCVHPLKVRVMQGTSTTGPTSTFFVIACENNEVQIYVFDQSLSTFTKKSSQTIVNLRGIFTTFGDDGTGKNLVVASGGASGETGVVTEIFTIDQSTGTLNPPVSDTPVNGANDAVGGISGNSGLAFVAEANSVSIYSENNTTGALGSSPLFTQPDPGDPVALGFKADPFLFVANAGLNQVDAFGVNTSTGALTPVSGSPFAVGGEPVAVAIADNKFLYTANARDGTVSAFSLNASSGALTQIPGSPFAAGGEPFSLAVDPSGASLYVLNAADNNLSPFSINTSTGVLTQGISAAFPAPLSGANLSFIATTP